MIRNLTIATAIFLGLLAGCHKAPEPTPAAPAQSAQPAAAPAPAPDAASNPPASAPAAAPSATPPTADQAAAANPLNAPAPAPAAAEPAPPPPPPPPVVIPAGTTVSVRLGTALSSKTSQTGQSFPATVAHSISVKGAVAVPAGSSATGSVVAAKEKGKIKGEGELDITLTAITIKGITYPVSASVSEQTIKGKGSRTAKTTGGGAAGGALIGALAGGGKGAAIGAGVGAGVGFIGGAATGNKQIELPAETVVSFSLRQSITLKQ